MRVQRAQLKSWAFCAKRKIHLALESDATCDVLLTAAEYTQSFSICSLLLDLGKSMEDFIDTMAGPRALHPELSDHVSQPKHSILILRRANRIICAA